jgi:hypothetical protein
MSSGSFTFQGDYRRRAPVNLGRTTHEDRAALLKKAQEERRAREDKRRREIAAMKIQVFFFVGVLMGGVLEGTERGCVGQGWIATSVG